MKVTMLPFLHERKVYFSRMKEEQEYFYSTIKAPQGTLFMRMCISENKYYVFNQKGILRKRVDFSRQIILYGKPIAVSNNGLVFIFKVQKSEHANILAIDPQSLDMVHMKKVNIMQAIDSYMQAYQSLDLD